MTRALIGAGADVNVANDLGVTPRAERRQRPAAGRMFDDAGL